MLRFHRPAALLALSIAFSALSLGQAQDPVVAKIVDEGKNRSQVMKTLGHLSLKIGPRVTGSPQLTKAEKWAVSEFKRYGIANARREVWGDVPVGFSRGKSIGRMVSPLQADFQFSTMNWTEGTNGLVRGRAVKNPQTVDEAKKMAKQLKGAWVIMPYAVTMRGPQNKDAEELKAAVDAAGIAGRIYGSTSELVHAHGSWRDKSYEKRPKGIDITVRESDMSRITRNMEKGPVELEFNLDHKWIKGPIPQANVIADIVGTEKPEEMVIVCGHLDSWNAPGSQATNDNGTGVSVALEAARILQKIGARPKRTIRFILWTGEEQGLLGSRAYTKAHEAEMDKVVAVLNDDGGTGYHGGFNVSKDMEPMMAAAIAPIQAAFPDLPMTLNVSERFRQDSGSDHAAFLRYGVPAFGIEEGGDADYRYVWHTQNDRLENARPNYLVQSATCSAAVAWALANSETMLPRPPKPAEGEGSGRSRGSYDPEEDHHGHDH